MIIVSTYLLGKKMKKQLTSKLSKAILELGFIIYNIFTKKLNLMVVKLQKLIGDMGKFRIKDPKEVEN